MKVSAIIPTIGRPELARAVRSVLDQTVPVLPIVILDRPEMIGDVASQLAMLPHKLIVSEGGRGGGAARNLGVAASSSDVIAFLDDDDQWLPGKTSAQLDLLETSPRAVITSRSLLVGKKTRTVPKRIYRNDGPLVDYLLERSSLRLHKNFMQSSSLMMSRETATRVAWKSTFPRHQDWTLLIELSELGLEVLTHPAPLVNVYQGSLDSVSRSKDWRFSDSWLREYGRKASPRSRGDFLCSVVLRSAIAAGELQDARRILYEALKCRPHLPAIAVAISEFRYR